MSNTYHSSNSNSQNSRLSSTPIDSSVRFEYPHAQGSTPNTTSGPYSNSTSRPLPQSPYMPNGQNVNRNRSASNAQNRYQITPEACVSPVPPRLRKSQS